MRNMRRYAASVDTVGYDDGDSEGPFYRFFYAENMKQAYKTLRRGYRKMFSDLEMSGGILSLAIKPVGNKQGWHVLFDNRQAHFDAAMREHRRDVEEFMRKYGNKSKSDVR